MFVAHLSCSLHQRSSGRFSWLILPTSSPPLVFHCSASVTGAWMSCVGAHGWVAGITSHGSGIWSRGWLASSGSPWTPQAPILHLAIQLLISTYKTNTLHVTEMLFVRFCFLCPISHPLFFFLQHRLSWSEEFYYFYSPLENTSFR